MLVFIVFGVVCVIVFVCILGVVRFIVCLVSGSNVMVVIKKYKMMCCMVILILLIIDEYMLINFVGIRGLC